MSDSVMMIALLVLFLPLAGGLLALVPGKAGPLLLTMAAALATILSLFLIVEISGNGTQHISLEWFRTGGRAFMAGLLLDTPALFMTFVVALITFLVALFSMVYMGQDPGIRRYFFSIGFFATSMLGIVMADNLLMVFFFWELVGFSSYLLINHYFTREAASKAAFKAFLVNRIGDAGFIIGLALIWMNSGTFDLVVQGEEGSPVWSAAAGLCLFLGVVGKSAQFPLQVWLPDAMEGPTPASALIHAATMVAAGVYLLSRTLVFLDPAVLPVIAVIGAVTAFMGAVAAVSQYDIKKVLAYSTISQLGYMVMAMGVSAREEAMMHLFSHAFFKAGLFLAAGAIIYSLHNLEHQTGKAFDAQDMRLMGGLRKTMPWTFVLYLVFTAGLIGIPFTGGFLTKDAILTAAVAWLDGQYTWQSVVPFLGLVTVALTAYYMIRQIIMVFWGESRTPGADQAVPSASPWLMRIPLMVLAAGSLWFIWSPNPFALSSGWLNGWLFGHSEHSTDSLHNIIPLVALVLMILGGGWAYFRFREFTFRGERNLLDRLSVSNWWMDDIYRVLVVQPVIYLSGLAGRADRMILDRMIDWLGISYVLFSHIVSWFDRRVVDGTVHLIAGTARFTGGIAGYVSRGSVQFYLWVAVALALGLLWLLI